MRRMPPPKRPPRRPRRRRSGIPVPPLRRPGAPPGRLIAVRRVRRPASDPAVPPGRPAGRQDSRVQVARQTAAVLTVNTVSLVNQWQQTQLHLIPMSHIPIQPTPLMFHRLQRTASAGSPHLVALLGKYGHPSVSACLTGVSVVLALPAFLSSFYPL